MSKLFYQTKKNYNPLTKPGEINTEPSQTIANDTFTVKELLQRYANGQSLTRNEVHYFDSESIDTINKFYNPGALDLTDLDELRQNVSAMEKAVEQAYETRKKTLELEELEKQKQAEFEARLQTLSEEQNAES